MTPRVSSGLADELNEAVAVGVRSEALQTAATPASRIPEMVAESGANGITAAPQPDRASLPPTGGQAPLGESREPEDEDPRPLWERTVNAFQWQFATVFGKQLLQFVVVAVLARLLAPEDFGLVVQATIFVGFANLFQDMGAALALIQRKTITDRHIRVAFTFSMATGLVMTAVAWFGAWIPAQVFENPALEPLLQLLSLTLLFKSGAITSICLLTRRMDFRTSFWISTVSYVIGSAVVGVSLALAGYGPWALVWAYVAQDFLLCGLGLLIVRHPMRPLFAWTETKQLLDFGVGMTLSKVMFYLTQNLDMFVVGRWLGATPLGLYSRAYQLVIVSNEAFAQVLGRVLFPALSKLQDDIERLRNAYLRAVSMVSFVAFPIFTGLAVVAPEAIGFVFGPQWDASVRPLQALCAGGVFWSVTTLSDQVANATGAVYPMFRRRIVLAAAIFAGALIGSRIGIVGVAMGVATALLLTYFLMAHLCLRLTQCTWRQFAIAQIPGACVATVVTICAHLVALVLRAHGFSTFNTLALSVAVGVGVGLACVLTLPRTWLPDSSRWTLEKIEGIVTKVALSFHGKGFPVPFLAGKLEK